MSKKRSSQPKATQTGATGYYIFYREWPGWYSDSDFPFDKFNSLPDDKIEDAIEDFAKNECQKYRDLLQEAMDKRAGQAFPRRMPRMGLIQKEFRLSELREMAPDRLGFEALRQNVRATDDKEETIARIIRAEELAIAYKDKLLPQNVRRARLAQFTRKELANEAVCWKVGAKRTKGATIEVLLAAEKAAYEVEQKKRQESTQAEWDKTPLILRLVGVAKWAKFPRYADGGRVASLRQYVRRVDGLQDAQKLGKTMQHRFRSSQCLRFSYVPESEFSMEQLVENKRIIDEHLAGGQVPDEARELQSVIVEADKLARALREIAERGKPDGSSADTGASGTPNDASAAATGERRTHVDAGLDERACGTYVAHPEWTGEQVAKSIGCSRPHLYKLKCFSKLKKLIKAGSPTSLLGIKATDEQGNQTYDAWPSSDEQSCPHCRAEHTFKCPACELDDHACPVCHIEMHHSQ